MAPIDDYAGIDLDTPVLPACETFVGGLVYRLPRSTVTATQNGEAVVFSET